jgi:hypothetical protein
LADESTTEKQSSLVEQWLEEQQKWQRTELSYVDSMAGNDEFLQHLGNAMRGSLLAGKPYPSTPPPDASAPQNPADDRLDQVLFALHKIEGQLNDLRMTLDEVRNVGPRKRRKKVKAAE